MNLKSTYNKIAPDWAKSHAAYTWWVEGTDKFCSLLEPRASVLDVGCGFGFKTDYIASKGFRASGIDFSESMIALAKKKYPKLDFAVFDIYDLDKYGKTFDAVFAQAVLLHIPKARVFEALQKMKSRLNEGGFLYIAVKGMREGRAEEEMKKENDYGYEYERFFSYFTMPELEDYFRKLNMEVAWKSATISGQANWLQIIGKKA